MSFTATLKKRWHDADSMLCVGLDPDPRRIPAHLGVGHAALSRFCRNIIEATADLVCAFKPQIAHFAALGAESLLADLIEEIHQQYPGIPVILDAKRGDIGSTAQQYGIEAFDRYKADALTLSPFMGFDSIEPYFEWEGRGLILLCRTSNPGGDDLQTLNVRSEAAPDTKRHRGGTGFISSGGSLQTADENNGQSQRLYEHLAQLAAGPWNRNGEMGLVVGATVPHELARVRQLAPNLPLLVPGIGAQGGDIDVTVQAGLDADGYGLIINSSRAILYASNGANYVSAARNVAQLTRDSIRAAKVKAQDSFRRPGP
ncbi:MAG: orotidine-5'-phosphate decarboxylase [Lautropia sp.]|nr:orotidine-5'-phosphate decarboxylase [Lautropia sp.]